MFWILSNQQRYFWCTYYKKDDEITEGRIRFLLNGTSICNSSSFNKFRDKTICHSPLKIGQSTFYKNKMKQGYHASLGCDPIDKQTDKDSWLSSRFQTQRKWIILTAYLKRSVTRNGRYLCVVRSSGRGKTSKVYSNHTFCDTHMCSIDAKNATV